VRSRFYHPSYVARERLPLEEAVRKVEAEAARRARETRAAPRKPPSPFLPLRRDKLAASAAAPVAACPALI